MQYRNLARTEYVLFPVQLLARPCAAEKLSAAVNGTLVILVIAVLVVGGFDCGTLYDLMIAVAVLFVHHVRFTQGTVVRFVRMMTAVPFAVVCHLTFLMQLVGAVLLYRTPFAGKPMVIGIVIRSVHGIVVIDGRQLRRFRRAANAGLGFAAL